MVIEFPKKYSVVNFWGMSYTVTVPAEYNNALAEILKKQPWISAIYPPKFDNENFFLTVSSAYSVTPEQAHDALCRLCEHVMSPPVDVDMTVWGDALESEDEHGQPNQSAES